ncbi:hypothetical protein [Micromonospora mirobrigensis]|uniref:Uncharacterized protein n=1 Tax=Micromonospora mirobrigensis TaxID=262898 RepID=A0A1C4Y9L2_9ACTN|nr:hypothetical protein [Micromonospora mirobrigensis]SCF17408.1 hypothetical protein GA0070564_103651 [Micromonospora mirobrigensis]
MIEPEDLIVGAELAAYREAVVPAVRPAGPGAVRATVRRRRRRTAVVTAAAVVLAVAVPVAGRAALDRDPGPPVPGPARSVEPAPSVTPSGNPSSVPTPSTPATATATPTGSPEPAGSASSSPAAPDGRISKAQLLAVDVELPAWSSEECQADGRVRLRTSDKEVGEPALVSLTHGDVDGDGAEETVALLGCRYGEAVGKQVVVFDRDASRRIVTLGRVVRTGEGQRNLLEYQVTSAGSVRVRVADIQPCCDTPTYLVRDQWRTYRWSGGKFTQTGGPVAFGPDNRRTDLTLTADDLVLGTSDADGKRTGSLTVTVINKGPGDVPQLGFPELGQIGQPSGGEFDRCRTLPDGPVGYFCLLPGLRAGERRSLTFTFLVGPDVAEFSPVGVGHWDAQDRSWSDLVPVDNKVQVRTGG